MPFAFVFAALVSFSAAAQTPIYSVGNRVTGWNAGTAVHDTFLDEIQPIFTKRCVACHGCYEAPCQSNFQSYEGIRRGFNPQPIYGSKRLYETYPTRMQDATSVAQWRQHGFLPVVAHDSEPGAADRASRSGVEESLPRRFVQSSQERNAPGFDLSSALGLQQEVDAEKNSCVATESQLASHYSRYNLWNVVS